MKNLTNRNIRTEMVLKMTEQQKLVLVKREIRRERRINKPLNLWG
jgi:hypothetical protein